MMAEMPPGGNGRGMGPPTPPTRQGVAFDRSFVFSIPGILTALAMVFAFSAMVAIEASKSLFPVSVTYINGPAFHEFAVITSWLTLLLFLVVAALQLYRLIGIRGTIMKFIMIGHSATWALLTLISSSIVIDWAGDLQALASDGVLSALRASGALGLLESFALMGVTGLLVLDLLNIFKVSIFE